MSGHPSLATKAFPLSSVLPCGHLADQRAPAREKEPSLLGHRDVRLPAAANANVVPKLIERRAEPRR